MQHEITIRIPPKFQDNIEFITREFAKALNFKTIDINHVEIKKRSIDARKKRIQIQIQGIVYVHEDYKPAEKKLPYKQVKDSTPIHIIGSGPAGLFAAIECLELGLKPIIFERGKDIKARRRDLAAINKDHVVNPESNYCYGEGGAGTYSDGKLYTRSNKRGDIKKVLESLVLHGADKDILIDAHPHIGTNKLPALIEDIRETILKFGGEINFESKLTDFTVVNSKIESIQINGTTDVPVNHLILATGHSARDIFELLYHKKIAIEAKPFALGIRIEHPQSLINKMQYSNSPDMEFLPPASYSFVANINGRGVYSFCMCPGGIIAPCATSPGEIVTNGWSPSKRNNPYANSGIVVELKEEDFEKFKDKGPLAGMYLQQEIEQRAFKLAGGTQAAPAQRLPDFLNNKKSEDLPECSYLPGTVSVELNMLFPKTISQTLKKGLRQFTKQATQYYSRDAILVGPESRTSSPVRIPRDKDTLQHTEISNLYPCAEGAGYAGGIVSAAIDGQRCVQEIKKIV